MYLETLAGMKKNSSMSQWVGKLSACLALMSKLDLLISVLSLIAIVILTAYGVVTRYVLNAPSTWVEELCLALFVWMTFMGVSALMRTDELVRIDLLVQKLPTALHRIVDDVLRPLLLIVTICFIVYLGCKLLPFSQVRFTPALKIPYVYIYLAVPMSGVIMIYHQIVHLITALKKYQQE